MSSDKNDITFLQRNPEDVYVIHCAYGKANNENHFSPRIYCIYLKNLDSSYSAKFSLETYGSKNDIPINDIPDWYDDLELYILDDLNDFLKSKSDCLFIYWAEQGNELILDILKTRFEELNKAGTTKRFFEIPMQQRKSVQSLLQNLSKASFINQTDLKVFVRDHNNQQLINGYLQGSEESVCFTRKEYDKITLSITAKVDFFIKIINQQPTSPKTKTEITSPLDLQSFSLGWLLKRLSIGSWLLMGGILIGTFLTGLGINDYFSSKNEKALDREIQDLKKQNEKQQQDYEGDKKSLLDSILKLNSKINKMSQK